MPSLGRQITLARVRKGWKQKTLADEAGLSQKYVSQIEHGHVDPRWSIVQRLASALGVSLDLLSSEVQHADA